LIVAIPKLSEARLGSSKAVEFLRIWHFLARAQVFGDYLEFGVFSGTSFDLSLRAAAHFFDRRARTAPRFFAFDSFEGLPAPVVERDGTVFEERSYKAPRPLFEETIATAARGWQVRVVPGYYNVSLTPQVVHEHNLRAAAFVNIDCDLYDSTMSALEFVTPLLQTGTVIYFDDWFYCGGDMRLGEAGACADWLAKNPAISLVDYGNVGVMGKIFIVNRS
jgi:hypothetical protein